MAKYKSDFLNIMEERGFFHQCTNPEGLDDLLSTETVTAYCGVDPTGDSLHVGHMVPYMMMRWLQKCGHKPIILMGGITAAIGDPTLKNESRKLLDEQTIAANIQSIKTIFKNFVTFGDGTSDAELVNNADWLKDLNYIQFLREYGTCFTINRMLSMESVKQRLDREQPLSFLEFNYMILQGYDFLELYREKNCRLQISGADQWGNVIQGVELGRRKAQTELFGLTAPLLTTASGKKMGKTEDGAVWLSADKLSPYDYYQYWRNVEDADVGRFLRTFTELPIAEVEKLEVLEGAEVNEAKKVLAFETTSFIHGEAAAHQAAETARQTFEEGTAAEGLPTVTISRSQLEQGMPVFMLLKEAGLVASNGEAKRLIKGGGARINDNPVSDDSQTLNLADISKDGTIKLSAGKKKHALIKPVD